MRWRLEGDDGQGTLFDGVERVPGRGEFRGMEFLHVRAGRLINTLPRSSRLPFRHTINAYRGCSHACSYCAWGDTSVLLGDGRTRRLADLRPGDEIYGTERVGAYRRYVRTTVLDHWGTGPKPAFRTTLSDGTTLVTSGDHRVLTNRGWKHVAGGTCGRGRRPHLRLTDELPAARALAERPADESGRAVGQVHTGGPPTSTIARMRSIDGAAVETAGHLRVVSVEPLGLDLPMYDITTGTGDFVSDGVISHNCFARPTHDYLGLDVDGGFDRQIVVKVNAVERLRAELDPRRWSGEPIAMGTNTDPYQRCEGRYHLTQGLVEVLSAARNPFSILTKSTLVLRDADLLAEAAARTQVSLTFSVGTLDEDVWRATEPGTPPPWKRIEAIARLREKGVDAGVLVAPVLPGLSDGAEQLEAVVRAATEAGATSVGGGMVVYLKPPVREVFLRRLRSTHPELVASYEEAYGDRSYPARHVQAAVRRRLDAAVDRHRPASAVRVRRWRPVRQPEAPPPADPGEQLSLGV